MGKNVLIVLLVVVIVGGAYYYFQNNKKGSEVNREGGQATTTDATGGAPSAKRSLRDLLALGASQKCTFDSEVDGQKSEGTVYVSGSHVRGDFASRVDANGKLVTSHMITDGQEIRMWQDGETMGFLMTVPASGDVPQSSPGAGEESLDYDEKVNYRCATWASDNAVFLPPSTVMFHSMSDMMQTDGVGMGGDARMMEGMEGVDMDMGAAAGGVELKEQQCRACEDVIGAENKAQCRAAFECE